MRKILLSKLLLIILLFQALISNAQSPTAPALAFNVFTQNGCTFYSSETEGPVAMGGDLTIAGSYGVAAHGNFSYQVGGVNIGLLVGGRVNYNGGSSLQVLNNGYVKIGTQNGSKAWYLDNNNAGSPIRITPSTDYNGSPNILLSAHASDLGNVNANNNPVFQSGLIDFTAAFTTMKATATSMSGITANADLTNPNGNIHSASIPAVVTSGQVKINLASGNNILNVTGDELNSVNNFTFNNAPDANHVLIINVNASGTFNWSAWTNGGFGGQSNCAYIIYNFYNTTTLNIGGNGAIEGTVFAPYADISKSGNNSNIEGQVICKSYSQSAGGEIHSSNFTPNSPACAPPSVPTVSVTGPTCSSANGSVAITSSTAGLTFSINGSSYSSYATPFAVAAGASYSITAKNASGCISTAVTGTMSAQPATPSAPTVSVTGPTCSSANGSVAITSSTIGLTFSINGSSYSSYATPYTVAAGASYSITAMNASGCISTAVTGTMSAQPAQTVPTFTQVASICSGSALSALPTTSTNAVTGTWSPALNNTATTTYTFTPTAGQCATTATMTITVNAQTVPTFTQVSAICSGAALAALPTTSNNGITGTWSPALNNSATTTYTFTPTAGQCATTATMTITVNALPSVSIQQSGAFTSCSSGTITLTAAGALSYLWSNSSATTAISVNSPGTYSVTGTDVNGCRNSATTNVAAYAYSGVISGLTLTSMCSDTPTSRLAWRIINNNSVAVPYTWTIYGTGQTGSGIVPANSTIYYYSTPYYTNTPSGISWGSNTMVLSWNDQNCNAQSTTKASGHSACSPNISTSVVNATCSGNNGGINLIVNGGQQPYTFAWSNGSSSQNLTNVAAGSYSVTVSSPNGTSSSTSATVNSVSASSASTTNASICAGSSYSFNGTNYATAGTYIAHLTNAAGCDSVATLVLTVNERPAAPTVNITQPTCNVATGSIAVTAPSGIGMTYSNDGSNYQSAASFASLVSGSYSITAKNANGCISTATSAIITNPPATPATPIFTRTQPTCNVATGTIIVTAPTGIGYTYRMDAGTAQSSTTFSSVAAGAHTITVIYAGGCTSSAAVSINAQPATPSAASLSLVQPTCNVPTGTITVTAPTGAGYTYSIDGTNYQSGTTFSNLAVGSYSVTVKSDGGCISTATSAVFVKANKPNDFAYTSNYLTTTQPLSSNSFGFVVYGNASGDTYNWNFGDGTTSNSATPTKSYNAFGIYNVRLIATNIGGCSDTTYQTVVVTPSSKPMDAVPVCNAATATKITQTLIFPRSTTDWASSNLKSQKAAKFDTTLGTLLAVKVINNGSFTTNNKVEITGNMAAGTKRLVNIQVDGTMDFYAPGFLYGITPPTIIDSFSSTGFDGVKDFAGTSGKDFGPHTSAKTDSTVFTSAASLANYKGSDSIALIVYTNTNFSASFPTGNDTASISTTATDTATIVYYYCPSSGVVSGGEGGGLESKSLGDAIVKRVYNKAFNSLQQPLDYSSMSPVAEKAVRATTMGVGIGGKLTLADILPQHLSKYSLTSYISTPTDIPSITNANDVLSIDYTLNNQAKAVSFGTQTSNAVYDHTKAICDRLKGSVLIDLKNVVINNVPMVTYTLKTATGNTEYAMSFAIGSKTGRNNYTLQSNWLNQDYKVDETMYNIQLWAVSPTMVTDMATDIINNLQSIMPIQAIAAKKLPDTYITSGSRDRTNLVLSVTNNQTNSNGYFVVEDKSNELSTGTTKRTVPFTVAANGKAQITVPMSDTYESTISMYINNQLQDVVYMADGTWSYGAGPATTVTSFKVSNDTNKTYSSDELPVFRNIQVNGTSADYVSVFKLMKGGAIAQDLSAYKTLKFAAEGGYNLRITLVKSSIVKWADQYNTLIPLDKASKEYLVSLDAFTSALSKDKINANDITTIVFSIEVVNGQNSALNTTLNSISFTKQEASYLQSLTAKDVQLYPNPATGNRFTCSFMSDKPAQLTLRVIDMTTGQVMHTQQVAAVTGINNVQVDLNRRNAGSSVYIIALDGESVQYKKAKIIAGN